MGRDGTADSSTRVDTAVRFHRLGRRGCMFTSLELSQIRELQTFSLNELRDMAARLEWDPWHVPFRAAVVREALRIKLLESRLVNPG